MRLCLLSQSRQPGPVSALRGPARRCAAASTSLTLASLRSEISRGTQTAGSARRRLVDQDSRRVLRPFPLLDSKSTRFERPTADVFKSQGQRRWGGDRSGQRLTTEAACTESLWSTTMWSRRSVTSKPQTLSARSCLSSLSRRGHWSSLGRRAQQGRRHRPR